MDMSEIFNSDAFIWYSQFAYQPLYVYLGIFGMMLASAFGLPIPEEVTLISVGFLAFMGSRPDLFPPPTPDASVVNMHEAALLAFIAVVGSDTLIYGLGRTFGRKILNYSWTQRMFPSSAQAKVEHWTNKYGPLAVFIFRFTPGVRFPGHLFCGLMKYNLWKFLAIDAIAALISVPTQIYLIALYGDHILSVLRQFKIIIFSLLAFVVIVVIIRKWREHRLEKVRAANQTLQNAK